MQVPSRFSDEPILGWRCWRADIDTGELYPTYYKQYGMPKWPECKQLEAKCHCYTTISHEPPLKDCTCGIWLRDTEHEARRDWRGTINTKPLTYNKTYVVGTANIWGTIIEHEFGWRAGRAYPSTIIVPRVLPQPPDDVSLLVAAMHAPDYDDVSIYDPMGLASMIGSRYRVEVYVE